MSAVPLYHSKGGTRAWEGQVLRHMQGYLTCKKTHRPRTLPRPMPRVLGGSWGGGRFLMSEVPLHAGAAVERIWHT